MATFDLADLHDVAVRNKRSAAACAMLRWVVVPWQMRDKRKVPTRTGWTQAGALRGPEIGEWWANNPNDIPGVVTGEESGIWVLDVDPRNGGTDSLMRLDTVGALGKTFRVDTPSGGWHLYFAWPSGGGVRSVNNLPGYPGLDVKGAGGFVGAPGATVFEVGEYRAPIGPASILSAPDWLLEIVRVGSPTFSVDGQDWSGVDGTEAGDEAWLRYQLEEMARVPPGGQHEALRWFTLQMRRRGMKQAEAELWSGQVAERFLSDPGRQPWTAEDGRRIVVGTWARIAPGVVEAELAGWAAGQAEPLPPPPASEVAVVLPPPVARVLGEPPGTLGPDDENGQEFRAFADGRLLWNSAMGWLVWNGQRWVPDDALKRHGVIREFGHKLVGQAAEADPDSWQKLVKRANRLGMVVGRDACLNYARDSFAIAPDELDADRMVLNTPTGLVDLQRGTIRPAVPEDLVTQMTTGPFVPDARDEVWERVLSDCIPDRADRDWLQMWMGYCLTGNDTEKAILAMHGPANTGKSTVTEPFAKALGSYAISWTADTIVANSNVNVQEALFRARAARLVVVNEMKVGTRLDEGVIKAATGGDRIVGRALYHGSIEYRGQFKLWVHTNHVPDTRDNALLARMLFFGMNRPLSHEQRQPWMKTWLEESEQAQAAVLWWAWQGLNKILGGIRLGKPHGSDEAVEEHALRSDPVRRFINEILRRGDDGDVIDHDALYMTYVAWCGPEQLKPMGPTKMSWALREHGIEKGRIRMTDGSRINGYRGWRYAGAVDQDV